jgi:hypothetical protein
MRIWRWIVLVVCGVTGPLNLLLSGSDLGRCARAGACPYWDAHGATVGAFGVLLALGAAYRIGRGW